MSQMQNFRVGHVHFIFYGVNFIRVGSRFSVEYGLKRFVSEEVKIRNSFSLRGDLNIYLLWVAACCSQLQQAVG